MNVNGTFYSSDAKYISRSHLEEYKKYIYSEFRMRCVQLRRFLKEKNKKNNMNLNKDSINVEKKNYNWKSKILFP